MPRQYSTQMINELKKNPALAVQSFSKEINNLLQQVLIQQRSIESFFKNISFFKKIFHPDVFRNVIENIHLYLHVRMNQIQEKDSYQELLQKIYIFSLNNCSYPVKSGLITFDDIKSSTELIFNKVTEDNQSSKLSFKAGLITTLLILSKLNSVSAQGDSEKNQLVSSSPPHMQNFNNNLSPIPPASYIALQESENQNRFSDYFTEHANVKQAVIGDQLKKADAWHQQECFFQEIEILENICEIDDITPTLKASILTRLAIAELRSGDFLSSKKTYESAKQLDANLKNAYDFGLSLAHISSEDVGKKLQGILFDIRKYSQKILKETYEAKPDNATYLETYLKVLDANQAIEVLEKHFEKNSKTEEFNLLLASNYLLIGDYEKAYKITDEILESGSKQTDVYALRGKIFTYLNDWEYAKASYKKRYELDPSIQNKLKLKSIELACIYMPEYETDRILGLAEKAKLLQSKKKYHQAHSIYEFLIASHATLPSYKDRVGDWYFQKVLCHYELFKILDEETVVELNLSINIEKGNGEKQLVFGKYFLEQGKYEKAAAYFAEALSLQPENPDYNLYYQQALYQLPDTSPTHKLTRTWNLLIQTAKNQIKTLSDAVKQEAKNSNSLPISEQVQATEQLINWPRFIRRLQHPLKVFLTGVAMISITKLYLTWSRNVQINNIALLNKITDSIFIKWRFTGGKYRIIFPLEGENISKRYRMEVTDFSDCLYQSLIDEKFDVKRADNKEIFLESCPDLNIQVVARIINSLQKNILTKKKTRKTTARDKAAPAPVPITNPQQSSVQSAVETDRSQEEYILSKAIKPTLTKGSDKRLTKIGKLNKPFVTKKQQGKNIEIYNEVHDLGQKWLDWKKAQLESEEKLNAEQREKEKKGYNKEPSTSKSSMPLYSLKKYTRTFNFTSATENQKPEISKNENLSVVYSKKRKKDNSNPQVCLSAITSHVKALNNSYQAQKRKESGFDLNQDVDITVYENSMFFHLIGFLSAHAELLKISAKETENNYHFNFLAIALIHGNYFQNIELESRIKHLEKFMELIGEHLIQKSNPKDNIEKEDLLVFSNTDDTAYVQVTKNIELKNLELYQRAISLWQTNSQEVFTTSSCFLRIQEKLFILERCMLFEHKQDVIGYAAQKLLLKQHQHNLDAATMQLILIGEVWGGFLETEGNISKEMKKTLSPEELAKLYEATEERLNKDLGLPNNLTDFLKNVRHNIRNTYRHDFKKEQDPVVIHKTALLGFTYINEVQQILDKIGAVSHGEHLVMKSGKMEI